jgi:hypothetical protein
MNSRTRTGLRLFLVFCFVPRFHGLHAGTVPADRLTEWNPGLTAAGGIPHRTTVFRTVAPSGGDDTPAIQEALNACPENQVVLLGPGDFHISSEGLLMDRSGITLRGSGPDQTRLLKDPEINWYPVICMGVRWSGDKVMDVSYGLSEDGVKESRAVRLASIPYPHMASGEIVLIDQEADPDLTEWSVDSPPGDDSRAWFLRRDRPLSQVMEVASAVGRTVTFTTPLHIAFRTAYRAQLSRYGEDGMGPDPRPATKWTGVEDLYLQKGSAGNVQLETCAYCWVRNVESCHTDGSSIDLTSCFRCEIRDSYVHTSDNPNPGGGGYLLSLSRGSADNLVENCIFWNANKVMVMRSTGGGNVIGYNYFEDGWIEYQPSWVESGANASHMTTPHFELFEGNEAFNFDGESTWGNSIYITVFRNHLTGKRRSVPPLQLTDEGFPRAASLSHGHWWYTFEGNVLGTETMDPSPYSAYTYESFFPWDSDPVGLWALGVGAEWGPADSKVLSTVIRHGNFDYVTRTVKWDPSVPDRDLPNSFYLSGRPAFFGDRPWPWVDPAGDVKLHRLPARERFDAAHGIASGTPEDPASASMPVTLRLSAFPNPFNSRVRVDYSAPSAGKVRFSVFDLTGRRVGVPDAGNPEQATGTVTWNAEGMPSGVYLIRLEAGSSAVTRKVTLVR